jgi:hypothetical protein
MDKTVVACVVSLLVFACSSAGSTPLGEETPDAGGNAQQDPEFPPPCADASSTWYAGRYSVGFEASVFLECGAEVSEDWWVDPPSSTTLLEGFSPPSNSSESLVIYAEICGAVSPAGEYGHLDAWDHEFVVTEVFFRSETIPDSCEPPPPSE